MFDDLFQDTGLSLERLQSLCLLAEAKGITLAARGDANRQSQFSRQIAELEAYFGVELLDRTSRPRRLTEAGRELAGIARASLSTLQEFRQRAMNQTARLVVGAGDSIIQWWLFPRLEKLQAMLPKVTLVFKNVTTKNAQSGLGRHGGVVRKSGGDSA